MYYNYYDPNMLANVLNNMYPEIYHRLLPMVKEKCTKLYNPYNYMINQLPNQEQINKMVEDIYKEYKQEKLQEGVKAENSDDLMRHHHRDPFKDLIKILIIKELVDNCCHPHHPYNPHHPHRRRRPWWY